MKINKSMLVTGLVTGVTAVSVAGAGVVSAQSANGNDGLIESLSTKLGLEQSVVKGAFDEIKSERQAEREAEAEAHLQELVDAGTITADQKTKLQEFRAEMQTLRESLQDQDLTREEMKEATEEQRAEFEAWLESEGISLEDIRPEGKDGGRRGHRGGFRGGAAETDATAEES